MIPFTTIIVNIRVSDMSDAGPVELPHLGEFDGLTMSNIRTGSDVD